MYQSVKERWVREGGKDLIGKEILRLHSEVGKLLMGSLFNREIERCVKEGGRWFKLLLMSPRMERERREWGRASKGLEKR